MLIGLWAYTAATIFHLLWDKFFPRFPSSTPPLDPVGAFDPRTSLTSPTFRYRVNTPVWAYGLAIFVKLPYTCIRCSFIDTALQIFQSDR